MKLHEIENFIYFLFKNGKRLPNKFKNKKIKKEGWFNY